MAVSNLLSIDEADCTRCGLCAAVCPRGIVVIGSKVPRTLRSGAEKCTKCGHCIAACPVQKLRHELLPDECLPLAADWRGTVEAVGNLIRGRRSIRRYRPEPVEKSKLLELLDMVRYAPTGMNSQSVKWLIIYDTATVKKLAGAVIEWMRELSRGGRLIAGKYDPSQLIAAWDMGIDPILRGCTHVLVACGRQDDPMAAGSCIIALTTAELAAQPLGLGTCWAGFLHIAAMSSQAVRDAMNLPADCVMHGGLMIGYPDETYHSIPPRNQPDVDWR